MGNRLADVLRRAADGRFPAPDDAVEVVPPWRPGVEAVVALTRHALVATELSLADVLEAGADGVGGASSPPVLARLAGSHGVGEPLDALLAGRGTGRSGLPERRDLDDHPRVAAARRWRSEVHVHGDERGVVTIAAGVAGLAELSFEVPEAVRGRGVGRSLLEDALGLVPTGDVVLVSIAPGNAASVRTALAVGFVPVGSVVLVRPGRAG
jgi:GNAT superfamily N-acetyltransferase